MLKIIVRSPVSDIFLYTMFITGVFTLALSYSAYNDAFQGLQIMGSTQSMIMICLTVSLMYLMLCILLSSIVSKGELHISRTLPDSPPRKT